MTTPIRFGGLASGIDTDSIIKQLMTVERIPVDRLEQKKQLTTWKVDAFREVNRSLLALRNNAVDLTLSKNFYARIATSSDESRVSVSATPSAGNTSIQITEVTALAKSASTYSVMPNGVTEVVDQNNVKVTKDTKLVDLNGVSPSTLSFKSSESGTLVSLNLTDTSTVGDLLNKLNAKDSGVSAFFDDATGKLSITSRQTGTDATIEFNDTTITDAFYLTNGVNGSNAEFTVNGMAISRASNTVTIDNVTLTLNQTFNASSSPVSLNTKPDTQAVFDKIKSFVDKYNETIELMSNKYSERQYRDFPPLTTEQKEELSEEEIKKWEEKAMSGLLRSDSKLRSGLDSLRSAWSSTDVTTSGPNQLYQIGLSTGKDFRAGGKIEIDEVKLKEAIETDPESVYKLFSDSTNGLLTKVRDITRDVRTGITREAGADGGVSNSFSLGRELVTIDKRIDSLNRQLFDKENAYYRRFTAMEKAMNQANSQAGYLQQYLGGGM
ncbi:flagellar filament capping protein FliD [Exiguobacterium aestuarii]|uniref:Flagellar hook-associated protein 2 n=1 Tax=Exiguobacterium aestuarii TaxID=273527 RepID=A0ABW2PI32_9BACL|nr:MULTISPECIES: flagellar filament capping protein FliD [Exiguobacterium]MCT4785246.1 flagellar filament capping protein FliD [Exiguobacterium aestuarii]